jgi:nucleotide-binding universal stress UspA family protein
MMFGKILLPIELAEEALTEDALLHAEALADSCDGEIRIVTVQSLIPVMLLDYVPQDFNEETRRGLEKETAAIAGRIRRPPHKVSSTVLFGPVYQRVLEEAEHWGASIIVVSSHRPGMGRFLIGSNADAIVRHAPCSVLVLREGPRR